MPRARIFAQAGRGQGEGMSRSRGPTLRGLGLLWSHLSFPGEVAS